MRRSPRSSIRFRIKTLDQRDFIRPLPVQKVPSMLFVWSDGEGLANSVGVNELHGDEVAIGYRCSVGDGKGVFEDGFDGTPNIDDLIAAFEELIGFLGEVITHTVGANFIALIDMHTLYRTAKSYCSRAPIWLIALIYCLAPNRMVEDKDLGCAGPVLQVSINVLNRPTLRSRQQQPVYPRKKEQGHEHFFQQLLYFWIIDLFNLIIIEEVFFHALVIVDLKARLIQGVLIFRPPDVVDSQGKILSSR